MPKVSEIIPGANLMVLMTGDPKSGKTTAWASFPEPIYCADLDYRMAPLASNPLTKTRDITFDSFNSYAELYQRLEEFQKHCPYQTVVIDSLTSLARLTINYLFENRGITQSQRKDKKAPMKTIGGIPVMDIEEYSGESSGLAQIMTKLRIIRNHGVNCVLTAHVITTEQPTLDGGTRITRRVVTGGNKIAAEIPSYFDEVYHFEYKLAGLSTEGGRYIARTKPSNTDFAGTSMQGIPDEIDFTDKLFYDELSKYFPISEVK